MENLTGIDGKAVWIRNWRQGVGQRWVVEEITWWHGVDKLIGSSRLGVHGYHIYMWRLANTSNSFQKSLPVYKSLRNTNEQPPWKGGINSRTHNDFVAWSKAFLFTRTSLKTFKWTTFQLDIVRSPHIFIVRTVSKTAQYQICWLV